MARWLSALITAPRPLMPLDPFEAECCLGDFGPALSPKVGIGLKKTPSSESLWRGEGDSNPRYPRGYSGFQEGRRRGRPRR
jgi:hypothetical protein